MGAQGQTARTWDSVDWDNVPDEYITAVYHTFETCRAADSLLDFVPRVSPYVDGTPVLRPTHLKLVAQAFAMAESQPMRICLSTPPRHSKTEIILHGIAWFLARHPSKRVIFVSATADFAKESSRKCMEYYIKAGGRIQPGAARADSWKTYAGGGLRAIGFGGQIVGRGADLFVLDDYCKNRQEAESLKIRREAWRTMQSAVMTRIQPGGSVIVVQTRWHKDDIIGRLERDFSDEWKIINLPCIAEENDPLGREPGEYLWPEFWSAKEMELRRRAVGEYEWAAQFQGRPMPEGTQLFNGVHYADDLELAEAIDQSRGLIICDPAATSKNYSDHSAIVVGYGYPDPKTRLPLCYIVDVIRVQVPIPQLINILVELNKMWNAPVGVEAVAGFKAIPQMMREINRDIKVFELPAVADKFTRSLPASAAWNDGRIKLRANQKWNGPFVREVQEFTGIGDDADDQADALAHFYRAMAEMLPQADILKRFDERQAISPLTPMG